MREVNPNDVRLSGRLCRVTLEPHVGLDWSVEAGGLEWDCRQTVGHIADALGFYAAHLGSRSDTWLKFDVVPHNDATNLHHVRLVDAMSEVLRQVAELTPNDVVAFHHSGMRTKNAFCAMASLEAVVHTGDVAEGLQVAFDPPRDLCARILHELFPGAPSGQDPWQVVLWATGRGDVRGRARLGADWLDHWARSTRPENAKVREQSR